MTTELTNAAQQALEACPFCGGKNIKVHSYSYVVIGGEPDAFAQCHDCSVTGPNGKTEAEAAEAWNTRALTQRPAAQEVAPKVIDWHTIALYLDEAHDEILDGRHDVARAMLREVCANIRASLPAPQQARPVQDGTRSPHDGEPMSARKAAYFMQRFRREEKLLGPNEQLAIDFVLALLEGPAATPEPVGEPFGWLFQHEETGLVQVVDSQQVEWGFEANNPRWQKIRPVYTRTDPIETEPVGEPVGEIVRSFNTGSGLEVKLRRGLTSDTPGIVGTMLFTRPAPGVPDGWREVIEKMVKGIDHLAELARQWEPDYSSGADRKGWVLAKNARDEAVDMLAAAQAKGGE